MSSQSKSKYIHRRLAELPKMQQSLSAGDLESVALIAHKVKGSAPTFGFDELGVLAPQLEDAARDAAEEVTELFDSYQLLVKETSNRFPPPATL